MYCCFLSSASTIPIFLALKHDPFTRVGGTDDDAETVTEEKHGEATRLVGIDTSAREGLSDEGWES